MKKALFIIIALLVAGTANAQMTVGTKKEKIASAASGFTRLYASIHPNDTTYYMAVQSNNQYHGPVIVDLGYKDEALALLQSMYDYVPQENDSILYLNNPSNNTATFENILGAEQYFIYEENSTGRIYGYLMISTIKKFIKKLSEYGGKS